LGSVKQLSFKLNSTDVGEWGMNTPNYFALGGLKYEQEDTEIALDFDALNLPSSGNNASQNYAIYNSGTITFDSISKVESIALTNTTTTAFSMKEGDQFAKQFEQGDWFNLTIYGWDENEIITDSVVFYLADFRSTDENEHYILDRWEEINLSNLGEIKQLSFKLNSSDVGEWGMNTPNFFALDDIYYEVTEEKTTGLSTHNIITKAYPNPSEGIVTVEAPAGTLRVLNLNGQIIREMNHDGHTVLDLTNQKSGIYLLELVSEGNRGVSKIVLK
jgi:hypothetical protein